MVFGPVRFVISRCSISGFSEGIVRVKTAPPVSLFSTEIVPFWASTKPFQ
jgi:hypothetical protein